ncbi:uncharacterized protein DUF1396 [Jatrophihabitans sp. GAS493]|uniref:LppX_LprAFG lipoprotein n=1 Tax=Jatrophihabitans sp. GAS493 TaxID=1907575 RepID=UPI000BB914F3|nr:LppX_LprAFG lipoprotein [Jatrophihabitans sp. GAS493]SOD71380.1 uncharacterized protein DUF1396 [Jatrophihabitans sp. GAS493]
MPTRTARPLASRSLVLTGALAAAAALAGCSTSAAGHAVKSAAPSLSTAAAASPTAPASTETTATGTISDGPSLATALQHSVDSLTSVHTVTDVRLSAGSTVESTSDEKLNGGALAAAIIDESVGGTPVKLVLVGSDMYAKLPQNMVKTTADKPWVHLTATSGNQIVRALNSSLASAIDQGGLNSALSYAQAATKVHVVGKETVNGASTTHVAALIDASLLPSDTARQLTQLGVTTFPSDFWIATDGHLVKVNQSLTLKGKVTTTSTSFSKFNAPISITAPSADEITPT